MAMDAYVSEISEPAALRPAAPIKPDLLYTFLWSGVGLVIAFILSAPEVLANLP